MIQRQYRLDQPYRVVIYARMSDATTQNPRSPEQQQATVREVMARCNCPWVVVESYVDRGIKGRFLRRRPGLQQMLRDIATGRVKVDLIVVDTFERFGRADEIEELRRRLRVEHGVLVVSADNGFADPTGIVGKAVGMVEQFRATEDGRVKAHQVVRGKKDALRRKRWPGGPPPFGYRLKRCVDEADARSPFYNVLEVDPESGPIVRAIFAKAHATGWGSSRLARFFNADPTIADRVKPFYAATVGMWLKNEVYVGLGVWGRVCTDIVNDARVIERNPYPEEIVRVEGFCEALVPRDVFLAVNKVREARASVARAAAAAAALDTSASTGQKLIRPVSPGLSIKHCLAGLVHCGRCNGCMVPRPTGR